MNRRKIMDINLSRNKFFKKDFIIAAIVLSLLLLGVGIIGLHNTIVIAHDGQEIQTSTLASTVEDVLREQNIEIGKGDKIIPELNEKLEDGTQIVIHRAFEIELVDGENTETLLTAENNVRNLLDTLNIKLEENDKIEPQLEQEISQGDRITITRITRDTLVETQDLPFQTVFKNNGTLEKGKTKRVQEGKLGLKEIKQEVVYENGIEVQRDTLEENIVEEPVNEIVERGTAGMLMATSRGDARYSQVVTMTATAYHAGYASTGKRPGDKYYGITATGTKVGPGVVAVDPNTIPLGSKLFVEGINGSANYGFCSAEDTGGAIKGNKIDLYFETPEQVKSFGRRTVKVYILN